MPFDIDKDRLGEATLFFADGTKIQAITSLREIEALSDEMQIELARVRHGRWLNERTGEPVPLDEDGNVVNSAYCSECQSWLVGSDEYGCKGRYCPNCGAKMDLEVTE